MIQALRPRGWFAIDFLHAATVIEALVPEADIVLAGTPVHISKRLTDDHRSVEKTIRLADGRSFVERVRLFTPTELQRMIEGAGAGVRCRFGDYSGGPLSAGTPRAILLAERAA
jgi:hypothetical protein